MTARRVYKIVTALLLAMVLLACNEKPLPAEKPTPNAEVPEVPLVRDRLFYAFDKGFISKPMHGYELASSYGPRIFLFDNENRFEKDVLNKVNPYTTWGYEGFLYHVGNKLYLLTAWLKVGTEERMGRLSVLDDRTFSLITQKDFPTKIEGADGEIPKSIFAFNEKEVFVVYNTNGIVERIDLETLKVEQVKGLAGKILTHVQVLGDRMYAGEYTGHDCKLLAYNPETGELESIDIGTPSKLMGWDGDILALAYAGRGVALYSVTKRKFVVPKLTLAKGFANPSNAVWDKKTNRLFLTFNESDRHMKNIFAVDLGSLSSSREEAVPQKVATLGMGGMGMGRTALFMDHNQGHLLAMYYHNDRHLGGGRAELFKIEEAGTLKSLGAHNLGRDMGMPPVVAYTTPLINN